MAQGKSSMQKFQGRIHWDDQRLAELRSVTAQTNPHPYNKDVRGEQAVGVQPSTLCGESRPDQGTRSSEKEQTGQRQLEGETRRRFCWWRPSFRYQELDEEVEHDVESPQDGEEHINILGVVQESPLLETSLIALVDTLVERIEPTRIEPIVEGFPSLDEMPTIVEISRAVTEFTGDGFPRQFHQFQVDLLALKRKVALV